MESARTILTKIFTEYYLSAAQAKKEGRPIAWITAFTPVEILRAMDITCVYPESYAVVCSASGKSQEMINASQMAHFTGDLCSYSLISFGMNGMARLPYGGLPEPDLLIATNNQCGTTLLWFRLLAQQKNIPLFVIDYPPSSENSAYILQQYKSLIAFITEHTGAGLNTNKLDDLIVNSKAACQLWSKLHNLNKSKSYKVSPSKLVDALFPIVAAKGSESVCRYYEALINEHAQKQDNAVNSNCVRLLWHGYPMWFLAGRFPDVFDERFQIVLNDYTLWWSLDYPQTDGLDAIVQPYARTYLNWPLERRIEWADKLIDDYSIDGVILHANRSCRRALAHIMPLRDHLGKKGIPSVTIESDMANPEFHSKEQVRLRIESFKERLRAN